MSDIIRLTQTVQKGGCAAKVPALELRQILARVRFPKNSAEILVDGSLMDDAAVVRLTADVALVQTLDFFTPIVDTPYRFGQIAAANALSDVYAMGGIPKTAMAILAFPLTKFTQEVIAQVLQGASDKIGESGADFVGGHSIDDDTLKFGLSVTGYVHPQRIWSNAGAQSGDALILIKPLGTGTATAALKRGEVLESDIEAELNSMSQLNSITQLLAESELEAIHAATDVTGFGLLGHSLQMARASQKTIEFTFASIPHFAKTLHFLEQGFLTKAHSSNKNYVGSEVQFKRELLPAESQLLYDPQTSGGLLLAVANDSANTILSKLNQKFAAAAVIGAVTEKSNSALAIL